ncbi:MAG: DNA repair protein RadA [Candidatus Nanoperiomorbaceae bacterium]
MSKSRTKFICQNCGAVYPKWMGRCENCGAWNSLLESVDDENTSAKNVVAKSRGAKLNYENIVNISEDLVDKRIATGIDDLDVVLGGGIMVGGVILLAGQPGIGKSTLLMQISAAMARDKNILYVSGEESAAQVKNRALRLLKNQSAHESKLSLASSTSADDVAQTILDGSFDVVIVDSMQTMALADVVSAPGTVSQITNSANVIIRAAKSSNTSVILVGHVTKDGAIAGPKVLEHLVDVVLNFEGDRYGGFKLVRAVKNRYGSTSEVAIFDMTDRGLEIVNNPSAALLAERSDSDGSVVLATLEGNRPLLVEVQALVNPTSFGYPKRAASGFDLNRLTLLVAVLERRTKLKLSDKDIFINVVGGLKLSDRAADLAVCMAIASASAQRKLRDGAVVFGEVGLGGEIRSAMSSDKRIMEAKKLGFKFAIAPKSAAKDKFVVPAVDLRDALNQHLK